MCVLGLEPGGPNLGPCGVAGVWRTGHAAQGAAGAHAGNIEEGFSTARAGVWPQTGPVREQGRLEDASSLSQAKSYKGPPTIGGKGQLLSRDSITSRAAGRLHTAEVARRSIDIREAAQWAKEESLQQEQSSTYQHKRA